jgi:SAM-dependent methyltransferase
MKHYTEEKLHEIYNTKVKLPPEYFKKYEVLPPCPVRGFNYSWHNKDYPRNLSILDFKEWVNKHNINCIEHLALTYRTDPELEFLKEVKSYTELPYPPNDLHLLDHKERYDFFMFNQTLEHLYNPFLAVKNIYNSLKPGGYVFTSVPTINIPHNTPIHYNGFNPMGLAMLFIDADFEVLEIGQWGNYDYIQQLFKTHFWPGHEKLQNPSGRILNEERNVCQCWILARKPFIVVS